MTFSYATFCSGIGAPELAWSRLGWRPLWASEFEPFPSAVLAHHHPVLPNLGDMEAINGSEAIKTYGRPDVVCAGTPCQSFSVAGLRAGMDDPRGNLALVYLRLVDEMRPDWVVWENVPGVLSSGQGRDFGSFLGALAELRYGFAWRILDAQWWGVAQRRRRVFVVGHSSGDWRRPAAVLLESASLRGDPAPSREAGEGVAHDVAPCVGASGRGFSRTGETRGQDPVVACPVVSPAMRAGGNRTGGDRPPGTDVDTADSPVVYSVGLGSDPLHAKELAQPSTTRHGDPGCVAFVEECQSGIREQGTSGTVCDGLPGSQQGGMVRHGLAVRRLTPTETERLQGFPDGYTAITYKGKSAADGPRYRALGNSMAVPVMRWIGERIQAGHALPKEETT